MFKIEAIMLNRNDEMDEKKDLYIASVTFDELINICCLGNIAINRGVKEERAQKMTQYIVDTNSFYPPIVVSSSYCNNLKYDEFTNKLSLNIKKEEDKLTIIDGQHRYLSIKNLLENKENKAHSSRKQSIFIINGINEYEQRKIFMDINNTASSVKTGTKIRFENNLANYFSLVVIDEIREFKQIISMEINQTSDPKVIPYKYIVFFNKAMVKVLNEKFTNGEKNFSEIKSYGAEIVEIWKRIYKLISNCIDSEDKIITNEVFFIALGEIISENFTIGNMEISELENYIKNIENNITTISEKYFKEKFNLKNDKVKKIIELLKEIEV